MIPFRKISFVLGIVIPILLGSVKFGGGFGIIDTWRFATACFSATPRFCFLIWGIQGS